MIRPDGPAADQTCWRFRLAHGQDLLDAWSTAATQSSRNAVYRLLFAVQDGSVFRRYPVVDDERALDFSVRLRGDVVVTIRIDDDTFKIVRIGTTTELVA